MRFWVGLGIIVLAMVMVTRTTLFQQTAKPELALNHPLLDEEFTNVHLIRFDKEGNLSQVVQVQKWIRYRDDKEVQLHKPMLQLHQENQSWHIFSDTGTAFQTKANGPLKMVTLNDNVRIQYHNQKETGWDLFTNELSLFPDQKEVTTDDWVKIVGNNYHMSAKGMSANLEKEDIQFSNSVQGEFNYDT